MIVVTKMLMISAARMARNARVCVLTPGRQAKPHQQVRECGTTTRKLLELAGWLLQNQVTHLGRESPGVSGKPIWNIGEAAGFTLTLAQAQHVKNVPGQKTETADGVWLAQRLRHGLLPASFVPAASLRELRRSACPMGDGMTGILGRRPRQNEKAREVSRALTPSRARPTACARRS